MARDFAKGFYNSKKWAHVRAYVLMRDHYRCTRCGSAKDLEVHHIQHLTPSNVNDASVSLATTNLTVLCRECHFREHARDKLEGQREYNNANKQARDCDADYEFDENGYLVPLAKTK